MKGQKALKNDGPSNRRGTYSKFGEHILYILNNTPRGSGGKKGKTGTVSNIGGEGGGGGL